MRFGLLELILPWLFEEQLPKVPYARLDLRYPLGQIVAILMGIALMVTGVVVGYWQSGAWDESAVFTDTGLGMMWGSIFAVPGLLVTLWAIRLRIAESIFSRVAWRIDPDPARLGEEITVEIEAEPGFTSRIEGVLAIVESRQISYDGRGRVVGSHEKYRRHRTMAPPSRLDAGRGEHWSATFRIPRGKTATYRTEGLVVRWTVGVRVKVPWWPDWRRMREIEVLPGGVE